MKTLSLMLRHNLDEWQSYQPECCHRIAPDAYRVTTGAISFDVGITEAEPDQSVLQAIDLAVSMAAQKRGWRTTVERETYNSDVYLNYVAKTLLGSYVVERECSEGAIARLQSYLAANRGDY